LGSISFDQLGYGEWKEFRFASLYPYEEEKKRRYESTPAQWDIFHADPTGRWGLKLRGNVSKDSEYFLFWNPHTNCFLGPHWDMTSFKMYKDKYFNPLCYAGGVVANNGYQYSEYRLGFTRIAVLNFSWWSG
jgi:hypothetical protein